uniref:GA2ox8 n=1 Tax=Pinus tabuliformis TaxID=88731 RepID=X5CFI5_PINTB|nr:GA2ox8 [Pinus tabuliformis]
MAPASANSFVNPKWGKVIPVESVQELVKNHVHPNAAEAVPPRYIRPQEERPTVSLIASSEFSIPVIDMKKLIILQGQEDQRKQEMERLSDACQEWGFFQIVNHGIPHSLIDEIKAVAKDFFNLPLEEKQKSAPQGGDPQGYGQMFVTAEDQTLDWGDLLALSLKPNQIKNLALWPTVPTNFRDTVKRYESEVERVAQELLSLFAENLHLEDADYFKNVFGSEPMNLMRMNFYPPCPRPDLVLGLSPHSDGGGITLLLQDDETEGLHVRKNNQWIPVKPIPYALVINIGDLVEVMTNGKYKSIEHRAVTNQERARLSIANFYNASVDAEVAPSPKLVDEHHPCLYRKFIHIDYIRYHLAKQLKGKRNLADFAKIDISKA